MDKKTLEALQASIKHWEANVAAKTIKETSTAASDCALCDLFLREHLCVGCPVFVKTEGRYCGRTPYIKADQAWRSKDLPSFHEAAQEELDFLRSLLPESSQ